jgi:hypothetical protein
MLEERKVQPILTQDLWGIICVGYLTKFYVLRRDSQMLEPYNDDDDDEALKCDEHC